MQEAAHINGNSHALQAKQRNLVNQRNFRNRRKEYVTELEEKVREYERNGIKATEKVQKAAHRVVSENAALRSLISTHMGWDEDTLQNHISQTLRNGELNLNVSARARARATGARTISAAPDVRKPPVVNRDLVSTSTLRPQKPLEKDPQERPSNRPSDPTSPQSTAASNGEWSTNTTTAGQSKSRGDVMSCDEAVAILCEFKSQANLESVRAELGCSPVDPCSITHKEVFQRLDTSL